MIYCKQIFTSGNAKAFCLRGTLEICCLFKGAVCQHGMSRYCFCWFLMAAQARVPPLAPSLGWGEPFCL